MARGMDILIVGASGFTGQESSSLSMIATAAVTFDTTTAVDAMPVMDK